MSHSGIDDESTGATTIQQQENRHIESRAGRLGAVSGESIGSRNVKRTTGEASSQRTNPNRFGKTQRGTTPGGILRELIDDVDEQSAYHSSQLTYHNSQLNYHNAQLKKLSARRRHLERLYQEISAQTGEGDDGELEDLEELGEDDSKPESAGELGEEIE